MIIALTGPARSGKDTVANLLDKHLGGIYRVQIAGPLKQILRDMFDWAETHTDGDLKDKPDTRYPRTHDQHFAPSTILAARLRDATLTCSRCGDVLDVSAPFDFGDRVEFSDPPRTMWKGPCVSYLVPREAMQWLGDPPFYPDIWAEKAARHAKMHDDAGFAAVVTDCRYLRDIRAMKNVGARIVQVHRDGAGLTGAAAQHRGEVERNSPEFQLLVDDHIYNDGTLDDLEAVVISRFGSVLTPNG